MMAPHLLVIGGTGFIGHHLLKAAKRQSWKLTSASLNPPSQDRHVDGVRYLLIDLTDASTIRRSLEEEYDYVVNLGGYIDHTLFQSGGRAMIEAQFTALQNLIETLPRGSLKRFVQIGSSDEYGNVPSPQHEALRENPISPYSLGKVASTHFLQMLHRTEGFPAVTLRLFLAYGPGQNNKRFLPQIIQGCLQNKEFPTSTGEQLRDFCYVEDVANAIIQTLTSEEMDGQVFNVASGQPIAIRTVIEQVRDLIGKGKPNFGAIPYRVGENMSLYADITRILNVLNWRPQVGLEDGLRNTINWYAERI
ncbi:MAG: NAD-dependent epimerase/dehydratase family protein [Cyanobacteria bacterium J06639_16]